MLSIGAQAPRDPSQKGTDRAALRAIAQAAVEVELFTIPLYMASMYSIQGMHQITSHGSDFYTGRLWPGSATTAQPTSANERAFNVVFSVFIQEMLHLQLASNIATPSACTPNYTTSVLQTERQRLDLLRPDDHRHSRTSSICGTPSRSTPRSSTSGR